MRNIKNICFIGNFIELKIKKNNKFKIIYIKFYFFVIYFIKLIIVDS